MKKAFLPSVCFAVLSTVAYEETVLAAQHETLVSENSQNTSIKYVDIDEGFLNLRESATTTAKVIATLIKDTEVVVYSEANGWSKVKVNGKVGFVSSQYLSPTKANGTEESVKTNNPVIKYVKINSGTLNLRANTSTSSQVITTLKNGTAVTVLSEANGWSKVKVAGKEGYVSSKYIVSNESNNSTNTKVSTSTNTSSNTETKYVNVSSGSLNLRASNSTSSSVLATLKKGTAVTVISEANGWSKVKVAGKEGYVSTKYLSSNKEQNGDTTNTNTNPNTVKNETKYVNVSSGSLNLRASNSTSSSVLATLKKGTAVTVISEANGWSKVKVAGKEGYVSTKYLSSNKEQNGDTTNTNTNPNTAKNETKYVNVSSGSLNLRASNSTSSSVLASLKKGTAVTVISEANGWSKVKVAGKEGYVSTKYLSSNKEQNGNTTNPDTNTQTTTKYVNVSSGSLNLRASNSTSSSVLASLKNGTAVTVISEANGWSKVKVAGKEGYVSTKYLKSKETDTSNSGNSSNSPVATTQYVNVSSGSLNMRKGPSTTSSIIFKLAKGKEVKVYSITNGWAKIEAFGQIGYVSSQYLSASKPGTGDNGDSSSTTTKYVEVSENSALNVRQSPSTNAKVITKLTNGTKVVVYSESNGWAKIKVNNIEGYVSSQFLRTTAPISKPDTPKEEEKTEVMYVNVSLGSSLNMRTSASTSSSIIVKLPRGLEVTVHSIQNGWAKIEAYGKVGYVSADYISKTKPTSSIDTEVPNDNNGGSQPETPAENEGIIKYVDVMVGSTLNMRSSASTSASIIAKLPRGTIVTVYSEENNWAKVSANGKTGYVSSEYLTSKEPYNPGTPNGDAEKITESYDITLEDMTNIQMKANPQTDKKYNTYIREDALTLTSSTSGTVKGSGWNVRGGAGTNHWVVGTVNKGENLQIISKVLGSDGYYWYQVNYNKSWVNASPEDVSYFLNPSNFLNTTVDSLQFLKLSVTANLDANEVNNKILAGKGILAGKADAFISAAEKYNVNELYLISHALLETGNGTSELATGVMVNGKTVYNMYGIGAYDGTALSSGAQYAYNAGWFTPEAAIIGGAKFIAQGYISAGQDTLYKMRWNPAAAVKNGYATHQYATDIGWAAKQVSQIYNLYSLLDSYKLVLEIPQYKSKK
ncbi:SH3 domain-containing protein [Metabacillus sp. 22489]|uniref:SH3 domain-containing protein n=1 Tax=Metabacillus sp. 22489 TaxID=3453928 RepID=UPI003F87788E